MVHEVGFDSEANVSLADSQASVSFTGGLTDAQLQAAAKVAQAHAKAVADAAARVAAQTKPEHSGA